MKFEKGGKISWVPLIFFVSYHSLLFVLLPLYVYLFGSPSWMVIVSSIALFFISGIGITAGYHRLFSHKAYRAKPFFQGLVLLAGTLAAQSPALEWAYDHRRHHNHTDTSKDPYSIKRGFLHAHFLWLFKHGEKKDFSRVPDLWSNRLVRAQYEQYVLLYVLLSVLVTGFVGLLSGDLFGAFVFSYLLRTFLVHHMTFFINSAAHTVGSRGHDNHSSAADNPLLAFFTFGEGYHNYHHAHPSDYRNGIRWYQYDPSKWVIWFSSKLGLANHLHRSK